VPDVIGRHLGSAIRAIESAGLNVVGYGTPESDPTGPDSTVHAQKPSGGERVPAGACVGFRTQ
jgi:beta-lactam-binding protein with PASTA domain